MRVFASQDRRTATPPGRIRAPRPGAVLPRPRRPEGRPAGKSAFSAMGRPATRRGYRRDGLRRLGMVGVGVGLWAAIGVALELVPSRQGAPVQVLFLELAAAGAVAVAGGLAALASWSRMGWVLRTHPWAVWDCPAPPVPGSAPGGAAFLFLGPDGEHRVRIPAYGWSTQWFADAETVWLAGSPGHGGVLSPDGGSHLLWFRPAPVSAALRIPAAGPRTPRH